LTVLVDAAALLKNEKDIKLVIIGEGPPLADLKSRANELGLSNLVFLPFQPRETLPQQLGAADVLVIMQKRAVTDIVFPGKLLYYMAAERAIIAAVSPDSETGRFVSDNQVGVVTQPEDPKAMAEAILRMRQEGMANYGKKGRAMVESQFDSRVVLPSFANYLENLAK
jgi:colanic acid biosynthesis glycosyl transferase WcaI